MSRDIGLTRRRVEAWGLRAAVRGWLQARPAAVTIHDLQRHLHEFQAHYNEHRLASIRQ
jgi:hypothetical protein